MSAAVRLALRRGGASRLALAQDIAHASGSNVAIGRRSAHEDALERPATQHAHSGIDNISRRRELSVPQKKPSSDRWSGRGSQRHSKNDRPTIARRTQAKQVHELDEETGEWHTKVVEENLAEYMKAQGMTNYDRRSDGRRVREAALNDLREKLGRGQGLEAWVAWQKLNAMDFYPPLPSYKLTLGVAQVVEEQMGFVLGTFVALAKHVILLEDASKNVAIPMAPFFRAREHEAAFQLVCDSLESPDLSSKPADGKLWHLVSQLVAVGAAAAVETGKELQLIEIVKKLAPFPVAGRGSESLDGCPVSLSHVRTVVNMLGITKETRDAALQLAAQTTLAWGIEFESEEFEKTASIAGRLGSMAGRRDWAGVKAVLERGRMARHTWLRIAADQDKDAHWNDSAWSVLLSNALANKQKDLVARAWDFYTDIKGPKASPSSRIWTALLSGYAQSRDYDSMMRTWQQLQQTPHARDWFIITTMISALFRAEQHDQAMLMFEEARRDAHERKVDVPVEVYNAVLLGLCFNFRREDAFALFDKMLKNGSDMPRPNVVTFNTLLRACGRMGDFDKASRFLEEMSRLGIKADRVTFTTVLDAMSRSGQTNDVSRVLDAMLAQGIVPNAVTMTALIKSYLTGEDGGPATDEAADADDLRVGKGGRGAERFDLAFEVLDYMERRGPTPNEVTYTAIISSLFTNPDRLRRYLQEGLIPVRFSAPKRDAVTSSEALFAERDWESRPEVGISMLLFRRMKQRNLQPNRTTYHTILAGILGAKDGITQAKRNYHIATNLWRLMQMDPVAKPNIQSWELMTTLLVNKTVAFDRGRDMAFPEMCKRLAWFLRTRDQDLQTTSSPQLEPVFARAQALLERNFLEQKERSGRPYRSRMDGDKYRLARERQESRFYEEA